MSNKTYDVKQTYYDYLTRIGDREKNISQRINNISDPLQAIDGIVENEGSTLRSIWESDSGYPLDGTTLLIIILPVALGIIGHYFASQWEPSPTGEELYDDFGNRIVEFPRMPIAYLQQTRKDLSATRENRNSLAWLCHRWLISTNDVVQELQAPYPLEKSTLRTVPEMTGQGKSIARIYEKLQKAALEWRIQLKKLKKDDLRKKLESRKSLKPLHTLPQKLMIRRAAATDMEYLRRRIPKARKLWNKMNKWIAEFLARPPQWKCHQSDSNDSYWSSSETFSSDSGEHWRSYKGDARRWARLRKATTQWKLDTARKLHEAATIAEEIRKKKEKEAAAKRDRETDSKSKNDSDSTKQSEKPESKASQPKGGPPRTMQSEKLKKQLTSKTGFGKLGKR